MALSVYVKLSLVLFGFAALLAAFDSDGFLPSLVEYFLGLTGAVLLIIVLELRVAPWMRRRLGVRGGSGSRSSHGGYSSDGSTGGGSDCGWSDPGSSGGGDGGGGDSGGGGC